ncbi:MAG: hypothetical protein IJP66_06885, partial [Kiritimatiellae bacterium]|nr:hypothetical protein [Kiritimatiellia bacterium]
MSLSKSKAQGQSLPYLVRINGNAKRRSVDVRSGVSRDEEVPERFQPLYHLNSLSSLSISPRTR